MTVIERDRLLNALARALERCEVADDPTGAADEAAAILREVVELDATEVHPPGAVEALLRAHRLLDAEHGHDVATWADRERWTAASLDAEGAVGDG